MRDAVGFLTVIPVRGGPLRQRSIALFPAVGALVGAGWVLAGWAGHQLGGPLVAAALVLTADLLLTGGLHLDGFADTADGLASRKPREEVRSVLKDPRIGAVGAAALGTGLLLRFALLAALVTALAAPSWGLLALAAVPVVGRCALAFLLPGARPRSDSLAAGAVIAARRWTVVTAAVLTAALVAAVAGPVDVLAAVAAVAVAVLVVDRWWRRRLGSAGDTIGAGGFLAELVMLAGLLALA